MNTAQTPETPERELVVINVFTVLPENQQALIDRIGSGGDPGEIPGVRSMTLLRSLDGTKVVNHMRWDSLEAFQRAVATTPAILETREAVSTLIEDAAPGLYEIVAHLAPDES